MEIQPLNFFMSLARISVAILIPTPDGFEIGDFPRDGGTLLKVWEGLRRLSLPLFSSVKTGYNGKWIIPLTSLSVSHTPLPR